MYTRLCSSVLFPIHEALKGHRSVVLREELEVSQWWSPEQLKEHQARALRSFLTNAGIEVRYYRDMFAAAGFNPAHVNSPGDLQSLPLLDKTAIRDHTSELEAKPARKLVRYNTGGSSGEPLVFFMGKDRVTHDVAAKWRATRWWGVDIGDPEVVLWGSPIEISRQDAAKRIRDKLFRSHLLPAFHMSHERMDQYLAAIRRIRPRMMFGYASALALLAEHARDRGVVLDRLGIRVCFATGETLYPTQRQSIEEAFGAPVANGYGSRDAGFIAHECPQGSLHLSAEHVIVELVDANDRPVAPGEQGEIVVTHMATGDFPFIRYRTGDMGVMGSRPCACGRGLPVLEQVLGRSTDFIRTKTGNAMHALALIYEARDKPGVRAFKFIQEEDLSLELQIVAGPEFNDEVEAAIRRGLHARMGEDAAIVVRTVAEIPPEKSGKYRYVVSKAPAP